MANVKIVMAKVMYRIFQLRDSRGTEYAFMGWDHAEEKFDFNDYHEVYSGEIDQLNCLENIFRRFETYFLLGRNLYLGSGLWVTPRDRTRGL